MNGQTNGKTCCKTSEKASCKTYGKTRRMTDGRAHLALLIAFLLSFFTLHLSAGCGTLDEFEEPPPSYEDTEAIDRRTPSVAEIRNLLAQITYTPRSGKGYNNMQVLPDGTLDTWIAQNRARIEEYAGYLPAGFVIEVVGHTDRTGPLYAGQGSPGNQWLSRERARRVYLKLIDAGMDASLLTFRGAADKELLSGREEGDPAHRRVTLSVTLQK